MTAKTAEDAAVLARAWKSERSSVNKVELIIEKDIVVIADQSQWLRSDCQEDRFRGSMIPLSCRPGKLGRGGGGITDGHLLGGSSALGRGNIWQYMKVITISRLKRSLLAFIKSNTFILFFKNQKF